MLWSWLGSIEYVETDQLHDKNLKRDPRRGIMLCKRCPHLVRHGQLASDKKTIEFQNNCGLIMKAKKANEAPADGQLKSMPRKNVKKLSEQTAKPPIPASVECSHFPFPKVFDYIECNIYQTIFKSSTRKNDVVPTKDFQYSDALSGSSITDMELL